MLQHVLDGKLQKYLRFAALLAVIWCFLIPAVQAQDTLVGLQARHDALTEQISRYETMLNSEQDILIPALLLTTEDRLEFFPLEIEQMQLIAVRKDLVGGLVVKISVERGVSVENVMKNLLLMNRAYRREIQDMLLPELRRNDEDILRQITDLRSPPPPASAPPAAPLVDLRDANVWSGSLDEVARIDVIDKFNAKRGQKLLAYSAGPVSIALHPDGYIEFMQMPTSTVQTRTDTTDGKDWVEVKTVTTYRTDGPVKLQGGNFDLSVTVDRNAYSKLGDLSQHAVNTVVRKARLTSIENGREKLLYLYNGQPSVAPVPWRLLPGTVN